MQTGRFMNQNNYRIVILIDRYLPILGGAQNNIHQVARDLINEGFQVTVLTRIVFPGLKRQESIDSVRVIRFSESRNRLVSKMGCIIAIVRYLITQKKDYDAVLCVPCAKHTDLFPAFPASLVTGKPYVVRTTSMSLYEGLLTIDFKSFPDVMKKLLFPPLLWRKVLNNASTIINQSVVILDRGRQHGLDSKLVIPNGVDTNKFYSVNRENAMIKRQSLGIPKTKIVITNTGRYVDVKNQIALLKVAKELILDGHEDIFILLLGAIEKGQVADNREQLVDFVQSNSLGDYVRFVDDADNVDDYLQASDIFVFPTRHVEGMSNSLLEAMATGLPIIASGMEQITCMFPKNYPYFFNPECNRELKDQLLDLARSETKRHEIGKIVEDHAQENYALTSTILRYKSLLLSL